MTRPVLIKSPKPKPSEASDPQPADPAPAKVVVSLGDGEICELSPAAFPIWQKCRTNLENVGCLDDVDAFLLTRYAEHYAEWIRLSGELRAVGTHEKLLSNKGKIYFSKRPECTRIEYLEGAMLKEERELGISRRSRRALQGGSARRATGSEKEHDTFFRERS